MRNQFDSAIPAFREAIRLQPNRWTSHLFLGISLYRKNDFNDASSSLEAASKMAPQEHRGRDEVDFWLGATRIASKQQLSGLAVLEKLLKRNPTHVDALELAVRTYADLSSAAWNQVADRHFETAPGYEVHGHALSSEGNREGALIAFRQSKAIQPDRAGPGLEIGKLLLLEGKAEPAWAELQQELKLREASPETAYYAALALIQLGRYAEAAPLLETAGKWLHRNPDVAMTLSQVYLGLKDPESAITPARTAIGLAPSSVAAHELLLSALAGVGRTQDIEAEQHRWSEQQKP
jgi:tetratricopeptide (TPR) repeat protein